MQFQDHVDNLSKLFLYRKHESVCLRGPNKFTAPVIRGTRRYFAHASEGTGIIFSVLIHIVYVPILYCTVVFMLFFSLLKL